MARIARCPKCGFPLCGGKDSPSALKRKAEADAAAERRRRREIEGEVRRWFAADFKIVYEAVARTKMNHAKKPQSEVLFQSILATHARKLDQLEQQVEAEVTRRLEKKR